MDIKMKLDKRNKIYIAGQTGLLGNAISERLKKDGYINQIYRSHKVMDLRNQESVYHFFQIEKPDVVILAAAKVGGIQANRTQMADFAMENLQITCNVIDAAHKFGVKKLLFLGSSCLYPKDAKQPVEESAILTGSCEPTNEGFAIAKIAGVRLCEYYQKQYGDNFISCIPANVYGPNDDFDPETGHVVSSLIARFDEAKRKNIKQVEIWGSGIAEREFLYIEDAAKACVKLLEIYEDPETINIGVGRMTSIKELAALIKQTVGYKGEVFFDTSKPDGMRKRSLNTIKAQKLGIYAETPLEEGLAKTYEWYLKNVVDKKGDQK